MNLTFWNVDRVLAEVDLTADRPTIDLGQVTFVEPFALVYLGMYLRHHNRLGRSIRVVVPSNQRVQEYLSRVNFWDRFNFDPEAIERDRLRRFNSATSFNDILDIERSATLAEDIADNVYRILWDGHVGVNRAHCAEVVAELVDNFSQHSERVLAACALQYYPNAHRVDFAIGDAGVGIRQSLVSNPKYAYLESRSHAEAATLAFEALVSRNPEGGTGLYEVAETVTIARGGLALSTGDGYVRIVEGTTETGPMALELPGVQIEVWFPED